MTANPLALEEQLCFAISVASRSVVSSYRDVLAPLGLTHPQYLVMLALWQHGPLSMGEVARLLHHEPATLSPLVKRLESSGLVQRNRTADDERRLAITLTSKGRALRKRALSVPVTMLARFDLDLEKLEALNTSLRELIAAADQVRPA